MKMNINAFSSEIDKNKKSLDNLFKYSILYNMERMDYEQWSVPEDLEIISYIDTYQYAWLLKQTYTDYSESSRPSDYTIALCIEAVVEAQRLRDIQNDIPKDNDLPF